MPNPKDNLILPKHESWEMFNAISPKYDLVNRLLTFGQDLSWRKRLGEHLPPQKGQIILDIATGTADVLITLLENYPAIRMGYGIDLAQKMLEIGRAKIEKRWLSKKIMLQTGDAQSLQFMNETFDCVTIAFGIRNLPDLHKALSEIYRVLKKGGRLLVLETALPQNAILRSGHLFFIRNIVPLIGLIVARNYRAYRYLNQTIESFPYAENFCTILKERGFQNTKCHPLLGGVTMIYQGDKL